MRTVINTLFKFCFNICFSKVAFIEKIRSDKDENKDKNIYEIEIHICGRAAGLRASADSTADSVHITFVNNQHTAFPFLTFRVHVAVSVVTMLMFCPTCANILGVEEGPKCLRFSCSTCPYVHNIARKISNRTYPKLKEV